MVALATFGMRGYPPILYLYRFMVTLNKSGFIGRGLHRECYRHPEHNNLCIKVVVSGDTSESRREKRCYRRLEKRGISWDMLPAFHGEIETNMGAGSVFDLVLDHDGAVSKSLEYYLSLNNEKEAYYGRLSNSLYLLKDYLLQNQIVTMTLKPKNILCKKMVSGKFQLYVVDNIGNSVFIPVCNVSRYFTKKKVSRKWKRFEDELLSKYKHNNALHHALQSRSSKK